MALTITYYGHSCFTVQSGDYTICMEPYTGVPGYADLRVKANKTYCSHEHDDHNYEKAVEIIAGGQNPFAVQEVIVPHDHHNGAHRGLCTARIFTAEGISVAHLGDLGRPLEESEIELRYGVDCLMVPVGGFFTVAAAEAAELVGRINAKLTILMHYRKGSEGYPKIADISEVAPAFPELKQLDQTTVELTRSGPKGIVTLLHK